MELWDLYDQNRNPIGKTHIRGEEIPEGCYHLAVHVWIKNSKGEWLISQRAASRPTFPLKWECVGGSVTAGDGVTCGDVAGNVRASDSVRCGNISGSVQAGGANFNGVNAGACSLLSDGRTKEEIEDLEKAEEFILALRPVRFKFKDRDGYHHGFIAQEVKEALRDGSDIVTETPAGMLGIRYQELTADLVAVVQQQQQRINDLEKRLASIEALLEGDGK